MNSFRAKDRLYDGSERHRRGECSARMRAGLAVDIEIEGLRAKAGKRASNAKGRTAERHDDERRKN